MNPTNYAMDEESNATYDKTVDDNEYIYDTFEQVVDKEGGDIVLDESSISVYVYNRQEYKEQDLIKNGTITADYSWEQFKEDNAAKVRFDVDDEIVNSLQVGTGVSNLTVVGYTTPVFVDYDKTARGKISIEQIVVLIILALLLILLAFALIKKTEPEDVEEIEPELEVSKLILSTEEEEQKEAEKGLEEIEEVESEYKKQISKFVDEKPEVVVALLRNWLNEDWE
jgi:flagellar biosynthesis/type III secretory pathway M-ring protein FliF/YscJ